jgi:hypothetical protein
LIVILVLLPFVVILGSILFFNIYMRKQIEEENTSKPIDLAYIEAEETRSDDEDL